MSRYSAIFIFDLGTLRTDLRQLVEEMYRRNKVTDGPDPDQLAMAWLRHQLVRDLYLLIVLEPVDYISYPLDGEFQNKAREMYQPLFSCMYQVFTHYHPVFEMECLVRLKTKDMYLHFRPRKS